MVNYEEITQRMNSIAKKIKENNTKENRDMYKQLRRNLKQLYPNMRVVNKNMYPNVKGVAEASGNKVYVFKKKPVYQEKKKSAVMTLLYKKRRRNKF
jgi:hypothetical protein